MKSTAINIKGLSAESAALFERLSAEYEIVDGAGLALLRSIGESLDRVSQARKIIERDGLVVETSSGPKAHPLLAVERDAKNAVFSGMRLLKIGSAELPE
jgi:hypothetical protein